MKSLLIVLTSICLLIPSFSQARDTRLLKSIDNAMQSKDFKERLSPNIKLYFGDTPTPVNARKLMNVTTNKKTNASNKSDDEACEWVFLSALMALQERAAKEGANAVTNIVSYYKKNPMSSTSEYECHAGTFIAGVALKADLVKIGN